MINESENVNLENLEVFQKQALLGYGTNVFVTKVIDGLLKALSIAATFHLDLGILWHINNLRSALAHYIEQQKKGQGGQTNAVDR